jgi:hypothetical protein
MRIGQASIDVLTMMTLRLDDMESILFLPESLLGICSAGVNANFAKVQKKPPRCVAAAVRYQFEKTC